MAVSVERLQRNPSGHSEEFNTSGMESDYPQRTPRRRGELLNLAMECASLFDKYEVKPHEKCYVGRLCQTLLEF